MEDLERRVEEQDADDAERDGRDCDHPPGQAEPSPEPRPGPRPASQQERRDEHAGADDREQVEAREHAAHVAHVAALALGQDGHPGDRDVEVRRPDHEVGEDRVGGGPQVALAVAGPRGGLRAPLLEADPSRGEEREDRDRDDHQRGGDADDEGREGAGQGVHGAPEATPPRGSAPAPTRCRP